MRSRPEKHFTPAKNWINDPNGLIYHSGYYHLYFQHNPYENKWGHMSWGHARSKDLINWEELPVAIHEQPKHAIFSGSAIFDIENNRIAAFYTAASTGKQSQWVCFSYDGGYTYQDHKEVLDLGLIDFRDPKVFKYQNHWIMVAVKSTEFLVSIFQSKDLINWEHLSDYHLPDVEVLYECPDLFEIDGKWVMFLSTNPGGAAGGSGMRYVIGDFNGREFKETSPVKYLDFGPDYYAAVTYNDAPERIAIGWMNNWEYANNLIRETWNGSMAAPRKLNIEDGKLIQRFIGETKYFEIPADQNFEFKYQNGALKFIRSGEKLIIDRSELWSQNLKSFEIPVTGSLKVEALFDAESLELSVNGQLATFLLEVSGEVPEFKAI